MKKMQYCYICNQPKERLNCLCSEVFGHTADVCQDCMKPHYYPSILFERVDGYNDRDTIAREEAEEIAKEEAEAKEIRLMGYIIDPMYQ